jgi:2-oxo-3-(phosphooxy)propyl 3-oxoalkanoate synthase
MQVATGPGLSFEQTVTRKLVHKHALDEVFITGWRVDSHVTLLTAVLPRAHAFYTEFPAEDRLPDLALLTEVCRQACFVVAHTRYEVPVVDNRYQFLLQEIESAFVAVRQLPPDRPVELLVECTIDESRRRGSELSALVWRFRVMDRSGEVHVAAVRMRMTWIDRGDWRRMREAMRRGRGLPSTPAPAPLAPAEVSPVLVGRRNQDNVVLQRIEASDASFRALARVDRRHPVLFDHPIDHVYAMIQLEASRQLAVYAHTERTSQLAEEIELCAVDSRFISVAELDLPLILTGSTVSGNGTADGELAHKLELRQENRLVSEVRLTTRPRTTYFRQWTLP